MPVRVETRIGSAVLESVTVRVPVSAPLVSGAKTTATVQVAPDARVDPQVFVCVKLPAVAMELMAIEMALVFVTVNVVAAERPPPA